LKIDDVIKHMQDSPCGEYHGICCQCNADVSLNVNIHGESISIEGGAIFCPPKAWHCPDLYVFKCQKCFDADPKFYPKTEVYSRVVGYMRPVSQWNDGKKAEFDIRKPFEAGTCCG
jgi:hypothetical protein